MDETIIVYFSSGIWTVFICTIKKIKDFIYHKFFYKWAACFADKEGNTYWIKSYKVCDIEPYMGIYLQWNEEIRKRYSIKDGWDKNRYVDDIPNLRYVPLKIAKKENMYELTPEIIKKFKKSIDKSVKPCYNTIRK